MRKITLVEGEYYHIYNRGVDKRKVFMNESEYVRFLAYMYVLNNTDSFDPSNFFRTHVPAEAFTSEIANPLVAFGAFCLMPNHFHFYLTPLVEDGVSKFMQRLQIAYTKYFNKKHERSGSLFESTFKAEHVSNENYAKYLFSYIHLNPAKLLDKNWKKKAQSEWGRLENYVKQYPYSSYQEYTSGKHSIISPKHFPNYLATKKDIKNHISDSIKYSPSEGF